MKSFLVIVLIVAGAAACVAQVSLPNQDQKQQFSRSIFGLGVSASFVNGFGFSFRHHLPSEISYQVGFGIIKTASNLLYNLGGEMQYDITRSGDTRFYACGGLGYFYAGESGSNDLSGPFRVGVGVGGELRKIESFHLSGGLMITYFSDGTIWPLPELSAHYYFY